MRVSHLGNPGNLKGSSKEVMMGQAQRKQGCFLLVLLFVCNIPAAFAAGVIGGVTADNSNYEALQAAEILGVSSDVQDLVSWKNRQDSSERVSAVRTRVLRRLLMGYLESRSASNKIEMEISYTYDVLSRLQRRNDTVNNLFNLANFVQFGTFYSTAAKSRIQKKFIQSSDLTLVGAGMGMGLPTMNIIYNKFSKVGDIKPPAFLQHAFSGGAVDGKELPPLVARYMDSKEYGASQTRRETMHAAWKKRFGVDAASSRGLVSLTDGKSQSAFALNNRIVLLWSLHTFIQGFEGQLLRLSRLIKDDSIGGGVFVSTGNARADEACRILGIAGPVTELVNMNRNHARDARRQQLELYVLERVLEASLDISELADRIDGEQNHAYNVALAALLARRGKGLQKNFEANFTKNGVFGSIAGYLYLHEYTKAGNEIFCINAGVGAFLSALALLQTHGGWMKNTEQKNSLASFFELEPEDRFSPIVCSYLNSRSFDSPDKTQREELMSLWKKHSVGTMNMSSKANQQRVAGSNKYDSIGLLRNRIVLLNSLKTRVVAFEPYLLEVLNVTATADSSNANGPGHSVGPVATAAVKLLGVSEEVDAVLSAKDRGTANDTAAQATQVQLLRRVLTAAVDVNSTCAHIEREIVTEQQALDRLNRWRSLGIALTNNANFFQISILGLVINGPLGYKKNPRYALAANRITITSGLMAIGLASLSFLEQKGGFRLAKASPNMLSQCLGVESNQNKYSPLVWKYFNSVPATSTNSKTHRDELLEYWRSSNNFDVNVDNASSREKLSASGPKHHQWNETIKMLRNRVYMLWDVRATTGLMDRGLIELLNTVDS